MKNLTFGRCKQLFLGTIFGAGLVLTGRAVPVQDGLVVQLDASGLVIVDETPPPDTERLVTVWHDRSGRGHDAKQSILEHNFPTFAAGVTPAGGDAVRFDGTRSQFLDIVGAPEFDGDAFTWYVVFRPAALNNGRMINAAYHDIDPDPEVTRFNQYTWASFPANNGRLRANVRNTNGDFVEAAVSGVVNTTSYFIGGAHWHNSGSGEISAIVVESSGARHVETTTGGTAVPRDHFLTRIGARLNPNIEAPTPVDPFSGEIAEIVVFNRVLSQSELLALEGYLHARHFQGSLGALPVTEGLLLWLDATEVTLEDVEFVGSERVVEWMDQSGRGNHAYEPLHAAAVRPRAAREVTPTGGDAVEFTGVADEFLDILSNPNDFDGPERTAYVVFSSTILNNGRAISGAWADIDPGPTMRTSYSVWGMFSNVGGRFRAFGRDAAGGFIEPIIGDVVVAGQFMIGGSIWNTNTQTFTSVVVDQGGERTTLSVGGLTALPSIHLFTRIGSGSAVASDIPNNPLTGHIAEILIYNRALNAEEQEAVEAYLYEKHFGSIPEPVGFAAWQAIHFSEAERLDPEISGAEANPAGDGIPNLLKYGFGLSPWMAVSMGDLVTLSLEDGNLRLTYPRNKNATDISYVAEVSDDLITWESGPTLTEEIAVVDAGDIEWVTVRATTLPGASTSGFMRVRMTVVGE